MSLIRVKCILGLLPLIGGVAAFDGDYVECKDGIYRVMAYEIVHSDEDYEFFEATLEEMEGVKIWEIIS